MSVVTFVVVVTFVFDVTLVVVVTFVFDRVRIRGDRVRSNIGDRVRIQALRPQESIASDGGLTASIKWGDAGVSGRVKKPSEESFGFSQECVEFVAGVVCVCVVVTFVVVVVTFVAVVTRGVLGSKVDEVGGGGEVSVRSSTLQMRRMWVGDVCVWLWSTG